MVLLKRIIGSIKRRFFVSPTITVKRSFKYDKKRYLKYAGCFLDSSREAELAQMVMAYHVIEKGLTMPRRRLNFGHASLLNLIQTILRFEKDYGKDDSQYEHAVGVVRAYYDLHVGEYKDFDSDIAYWRQVEGFCSSHRNVPIAQQYRYTRDSFFSANKLPFDEFARSRHTVRHFQGVVQEDIIRAAVALAMTAPSACNRQHVRVHCISNHKTRDSIFVLQGGNRGFAQDADKVLLVTFDLSDIRWPAERNDGFVNAGLFLMNLLYALHYYEIACCVLNWSVEPVNDRKIRRLVHIQDSETIVALVACGNPTDEFDVAASPRRMLDQVYFTED